MSRSADSKYLLCDAPNCTSRVDAPVALRSKPAGPDAASPIESPNQEFPRARWLFVQRGGIWQHFCPAHMAIALNWEVRDDQDSSNNASSDQSVPSASNESRLS